MPRVSIVTPFLDAEPFLAQAIDSVRAQTVPDWELLLVDDGARDGSRAVAEAAAAEDPRIRLLPAPAGPEGPAAARNRGLAAAGGEFVAFLDADDRLEPAMLAVTLDVLERRPDVAMVYGPTVWWHPDDPARDWTEPMDGRAGRVFPPPRLLVDVLLLQDGQVPCIGSVLVRRTALEAVGGFEESLRLYEDQTLWVKLFLRFPIAVVAEPLSRYRQHPASASAAAAAAGLYRRTGEHPARAAFLDWVGRHLEEAGDVAPAVRRALALARSPYREDASLAGRLLRFRFRLLRAWHRRRRRLRRRLGFG
ncbi:glycosyltransferase family 2 protein [Prosthecomicrobium sp. N25]|uniref:glycosyltransferase family 2 protein n=1 Tax=Prosthecomicrobium sp. N25 TaxID=3129254 RepID=UPI003076A457